MTTFLNEVQLNRMVPSVFATGSSERVSDRYGFIPTIEVLRGLEKNGFHPVKAMQCKTRIAGRKDHVKHMLRLRHETSTEVGGVVPEIVMVNSHDGSSSYQLRAGVYRLVCANGMIVGDELFCRRIKHQGDVIEKVVESADDLLRAIPDTVGKALEWQSLNLSYEQKLAFANAAATLKWEEENKLISDLQIVSPRRIADKKDDLWTTFNVVQENIIRGGISYRTENGGRNSTREVKSVNENVRLNTALWTLTEAMAKLIK